MSNTCLSNEYLNPIQINLAVVGLSGPSQVKGTSGVGKSSLCNRLVRPHKYNSQISTLTSVDFHSDIINGTHWIYWDHVLKIVDSKSYAFHIIEETILIDEQTFCPFANFTESEYISQAISGKLIGSKRAYLSPSQFAQTQNYFESRRIQDVIIDAFLIVYDVSEVSSRDYSAQDRFLTDLLNGLLKTKKPLILVISKTELLSSKIRSRLNSIMEKRNFKSIPLVETSASLNINISPIFTKIVSLINISNSQKSFPTFQSSKHLMGRFDSFECALKKQKETVEKLMIEFEQIVSIDVKKYYDVPWNEFSVRHDLTQFYELIDRIELQNRFEEFKTLSKKKLNETLMDSCVVLFKTLIFRFVDPLIDGVDDNDSGQIIHEILKNPQFLCHFKETDLSYEEVMKVTYLSTSIEFPLPMFFINVESSFNQLNVIKSCVKEKRYQKRLSEFSQNLLNTLNTSSDKYVDLSFNDIDKMFKDQESWREFRSIAKSIFDEFVENSIKNFKELFDEKLLELSFMIYSIDSMKKVVPKDLKKKNLFSDAIPDSSLIKSIDNKIYFDTEHFKKDVFQKNREKWIIRYIGSIVSSNPNQCYIFDFAPDNCCKHLKKYLDPVSSYQSSLIAVISMDKSVDDFWRDNTVSFVDLNTIVSDVTSPMEIQFYSSTLLDRPSFWENQFTPYHKVVFLLSDDFSVAYDLLNRLLEQKIVKAVQLSIINLAKHSSLSNNLLDETIKRLKIEYCNISWGLCPGQHLKKLINEQTNFHLLNSEPMIIWIVVLCRDTYDTSIPLSFFLSIFSDYIITDQSIINGLLTISLYFIPPNRVLPRKLSISIVSYHQAFKLMFYENRPIIPHLLIYFINIYRLASINTIFAVMKEILNLVNIRSIVCVVAYPISLDPIELKERKCMIERLASGSNVEYIIIDESEESNEVYLERLRDYINAFLKCNVNESENLCCYNDAFESEDIEGISRFQMTEEDIPQSKEYVKYREDYKEKSFEQKLFSDRCQTYGHSEFHDSNFFNFETNPLNVEIDSEYSIPLGNFNEELYQKIEEEFHFDEIEVKDKNTAIQVKCRNINHFEHRLDQSQIPESNKKPPTSKTRSNSGPATTNKSSSRKHNPNCYFPRPTKSLTTSPSAQTEKLIAHSKICKMDEADNSDESSPTNINHVSTSNKSIKNRFYKLFHSERYTNKSSEGRSLKIPKRHSDRKTKAPSKFYDP